MDELIVKRAVAGDKESFSNAVMELKDRAYKIAYCCLHNEHDSMDTVCDAVEKAYRNIKKLREPKFFSTWFIRIMINECKSHTRMEGIELSRDERELDIFFDSLDKYNIVVPEELGGRIMYRIGSIKNNKNYLIKIASSIAALLLIFVLSIQVFPGFRTYAGSLPVLGVVLKGFAAYDIGKDELNDIFKKAESVIIKADDAKKSIKALTREEIDVLDKACWDVEKVPSEKDYDIPSPEVIPFPGYNLEIKLKDTVITIRWASVHDNGSYFDVIPIAKPPAELIRYRVFQKSNALWDTLKRIMPIEKPTVSGDLESLNGAASLKVRTGKGASPDLGSIPIGPNKTLYIARLLRDSTAAKDKVVMKPLDEYPIVLEFSLGSEKNLVYIMDNSFIYMDKLYKSDMIQMRVIRAIMDPPYD